MVNCLSQVCCNKCFKNLDYKDAIIGVATGIGVTLLVVGIIKIGGVTMGFGLLGHYGAYGAIGLGGLTTIAGVAVFSVRHCKTEPNNHPESALEKNSPKSALEKFNEKVIIEEEISSPYSNIVLFKNKNISFDEDIKEDIESKYETIFEKIESKDPGPMSKFGIQAKTDLAEVQKYLSQDYITDFSHFYAETADLLPSATLMIWMDRFLIIGYFEIVPFLSPEGRKIKDSDTEPSIDPNFSTQLAGIKTKLVNATKQWKDLVELNKLSKQEIFELTTHYIAKEVLEGSEDAYSARELDKNQKTNLSAKISRMESKINEDEKLLIEQLAKDSRAIIQELRSYCSKLNFDRLITKAIENL